MKFELLTIPGCPNDEQARIVFVKALEAEVLDAGAVQVRAVETEEQAQALNFHGSPTFTANGADLFPVATAPAITCRVYPTKAGLAGNPTLEQLRAALRGAVASA